MGNVAVIRNRYTTRNQTVEPYAFYSAGAAELDQLFDERLSDEDFQRKLYGIEPREPAIGVVILKDVFVAAVLLSVAVFGLTAFAVGTWWLLREAVGLLLWLSA